MAKPNPKPGQFYTLPWPPSVNKAWVPGKNNGRTFLMLTDRQRDYRSQVMIAVRNAAANFILTGALEVEILLHPKTRARYDVDNFSKAILDGLTHAKVWEDDSQIQILTVIKGHKLATGAAVVKVWPLDMEVQNG